MTPESHAYDADEVHAYACLWEMHACGRCTSMRDARLEDEHLWDTRLWEMPTYGRYTPMGDARLLQIPAAFVPAL